MFDFNVKLYADSAITFPIKNRVKKSAKIISADSLNVGNSVRVSE